MENHFTGFGNDIYPEIYQKIILKWISSLQMSLDYEWSTITFNLLMKYALCKIWK